MSETGGSRRETAWLHDMTAGVRETAREAETPGELIRGLPDALAAVEQNQFVWIATVRQGSELIRVRAASGDAEFPGEIRLSAEQRPGPTARSAENGEIHISTRLSENPEYVALGVDGSLPAAAVGLHIPFEAAGEVGVLHLTTDHDSTATQFRDAGAVLGDTVTDALDLVETRSALDRERERIEAVRSTVSHDLGNPLNLASGRLELAAEECDSNHLSHATEALRRIDELAAEVVTFVEAGLPVEQREPRSIATIAADGWGELSTGESSLTTEQVTVEGEPERLRELVSELLDNTLTHTTGAVDVTVGPLADSRGFYVEDTGEGVPVDDREYIFSRGYTTAGDADGYGLAVAREIARAHGWEIRLADTQGGARFEVVTDRW